MSENLAQPDSAGKTGRSPKSDRIQKLTLIGIHSNDVVVDLHTDYSRSRTEIDLLAQILFSYIFCRCYPNDYISQGVENCIRCNKNNKAGAFPSDALERQIDYRE